MNQTMRFSSIESIRARDTGALFELAAQMISATDFVVHFGSDSMSNYIAAADEMIKALDLMEDNATAIEYRDALVACVDEVSGSVVSSLSDTLILA